MRVGSNMVRYAKEQEREIFEQTFQGHPEAMQFCLNILYIAHLWDDLIDKDKNRSDAEINSGFEILLLGIPSNPFYRAHQGSLLPMIHVAIACWYESNKRQKGTEDEKFYAFYLRNQLLSVVYFACLVVGGDPNPLHEYFAMQMKSQYDNFFMERLNNA